MRAATETHHPQQDESTRVLYDLCSIIIHILRSPPLPPAAVVSFPASLLSSPNPRQRHGQGHPSPAAFASLFLGISVAMMLFGSLTFLIGFFLLPVVIGLLFLFYFFGILYNLSEFGRAFLWPTTPVPPPGWRYL